MERRNFIKGSIAASVATVAAPSAMAKWSADSFEAKSVADATKALGLEGAKASDKITIKAPKTAENGLVVPISVTSDVEGTESISILVAENSSPLTAVYNLTADAAPQVSCRVKMGKTSDVIALVKAGDKTYKQSVSVKVTVGGCGG